MKRIFCILLSLTFVLGLMIPSFAVSGVDVHATVTTDKTNYQQGENIGVRINLKNSGDNDAVVMLKFTTTSLITVSLENNGSEILEAHSEMNKEYLAKAPVFNYSSFPELQRVWDIITGYILTTFYKIIVAFDSNKDCAQIKVDDVNAVIVVETVVEEILFEETTTQKPIVIEPTTNSVIEIKAVDFLGSSKEMYVGESVKLIWVFVPSNTTQKGITFTSSNPDVASVDHVGKVTAKSIGTATITVTSKFNKNLNDIYKIKVVEEKTTAEPATFPTWPTTTKPQTTVPTTKEPTTAEPTTEAPTTAYVPKEVSKIKLVGGKSREVNIGCYSSIICKTEPSGTTMKDLKFTSSDIGVCIVDANGRAFGVSPGTAVITITPKTGAATPETVYITVK